MRAPGKKISRATGMFSKDFFVCLLHYTYTTIAVAAAVAAGEVVAKGGLLWGEEQPVAAASE